MIHILKRGLAFCGAGRPSDWPAGDRWVAFDDVAVRELATCPECLRGLPVAQAWTVHLASAALLPPLDPSRPRVTLAAMARVPGWVIGLTRGRPAHAFADSPKERELMAAAIAERANPLLLQGGKAWAAYRDALDARWAPLVASSDLAPRAWHWTKHEAIPRPDGFPGSRTPGGMIGGPVPDGAYVVCTCRPSEGCHLRILAPHLRAAGWVVTLYGAPVP